jgi:hypothetical protein
MQYARAVFKWLVLGAAAAIFWGAFIELLHLWDWYPERRLAEFAVSAPLLIHQRAALWLLVIILAAITLVAMHWGPLLWTIGRGHHLHTFLERDSESDQLGIQTFPGITYIQISVTASKRITGCRAWYRRSDYSSDRTDPFSMEHNERHPLMWSKPGGTSNFEVDLKPNDPPIRITVAVFDLASLQFEPGVGTPTNLLPKLQRIGMHRLEISLVGFLNGKEIFETRHLFIDWRGPGKRTAFIKLEKP